MNSVSAPVMPLQQHKLRYNDMGSLTRKFYKILNELFRENSMSYFQNPINLDSSPSYLETVHQGMSLSVLRDIVCTGIYEHARLSFMRDLLRVFENATTYYPADSEVHQTAVAMRALAVEKVTAVCGETVVQGWIQSINTQKPKTVSFLL